MITSATLTTLGFIQDETNRNLFSIEATPLDFRLEENKNILLVGLDLSGPEESWQLFFSLSSNDRVQSFLCTIAPMV
jgi:hypothetical protein